MFDFMDNDYFIIGLEIVFAYFIITDLIKYKQERKKEHLIGAILSAGLFIYTLMPFYNKYYNWEEPQRDRVSKVCSKEIESFSKEQNITKKFDLTKSCECYNNRLFKEFSYSEFELLSVQGEKKLTDFKLENLKDCAEDNTL